MALYLNKNFSYRFYCTAYLSYSALFRAVAAFNLDMPCALIRPVMRSIIDCAMYRQKSIAGNATNTCAQNGRLVPGLKYMILHEINGFCLNPSIVGFIKELYASLWY